MSELADWRPETDAGNEHPNQLETKHSTKSDGLHADLLDRARATSAELRAVTEKRKRLRRAAESMYSAEILSKPEYETVKKALR
jgi:hypothetical protein